MNKTAFILVFFFLGICSSTHAQDTLTLDSTKLLERIVISNLDVPWEIIYGADGWIWTTEREGIISRINPVTGEKKVILNIQSTVYAESEAGMLGMVLHPNFFTTTPYLYVVYTYLVSNNIRERCVRYSYIGGNLINPFTLIEGINGNTTHIGSRLLILPDTTMLMSTGDYQNQPSAQANSSVSGKILRMHLDGSIPADNPIAGSLIYTKGHRNAQGLDLAPNGKLYCSEHGPTSDDEFHIIEPNRNYGWPTVVGMCNSVTEMQFCADSNVVQPLKAWTPTIGPSDIEYYEHDAIPEFKNTVLMTVLKDKYLMRIKLDAEGDSITATKNYFTNRWGRLRDICVAPNGTIYLATNGESWGNTDPGTHKIIELKPLATSTSLPTAPSIAPARLVPNPAQACNFVRIETKDVITQIQIFDIAGRLYATYDRPEENSISMQNLIKGIYFLEIVTASGRQMRKLVIQ